MTMPKHSDLYGNPQVDPVKREDVPQFYLGFLEQAAGGQPRPHDPRILDGAVARQDRRRRDDVRSVPDAEEAVSVRRAAARRSAVRRDADALAT